MSTQPSTRIILLDSHAIIHRAYHAMPEFATREGVPTGGLFGLASMLIKIIDDLQPDYIIAAYDLPKPTFRHEAYDDYKAGRAESDEALRQQITTSREIYAAFGIPIYDAEGYEADDVLGTIAEITKQDPSSEVIICTGDMDTLQLVDDAGQVRVYTPKKGLNETMLYDETAVHDRYGFGPDRLVDYKGLAGDPSDNIKGVPGIGDKTAKALIAAFGTVEDIVAALDQDPQVFADAGIKPRIVGLLTEHQDDALFSKELAKIKIDVPLTFALPDQRFADNINLADVGEIFRTYQFRALGDRLHKALGIETVADEAKQAGLFADVDVDETKLAEAKLAVHLLNPVIAQPVIDDIMRYGDDFDTAYQNLEDEIAKQGLDFVWRQIEIPLLPITQAMNQTGFAVDKKRLEKLSKQFHQQTDKLEQEIFAIAGKEFNVRSTQQLSTVLFDDLGLPTKGLKKTPKGVISTKESELEKIRSEHKIIDLILEHRELSKLTSTYTDSLLEQIDDQTGRVYPTFLQTGAATGRMACKDPNLQNIPTGSANGRLIRTAFVASPGKKLVSLDYSQIELRVVAMMSADPKLVEVFKAGGDIHDAVAHEVFGSGGPEARRKAKVINFGILYGMGANSLKKTLGDDVSVADARSYLDEYFVQFPGLAGYIEGTKQSVAETGYSETLYGRRRYFPDINSSVGFKKAMAERMAINAPVQGTATGDIPKLAMVDVAAWIAAEGLEDQVQLLAQIHDELVFEVDAKIAEEVGAKIQQIMESVMDQHPPVKDFAAVPLKTSVSVGDDLGELK